ncbi:unnamed protein product [Arctogadus glacialis]
MAESGDRKWPPFICSRSRQQTKVRSFLSSDQLTDLVTTRQGRTIRPLQQEYLTKEYGRREEIYSLLLYNPDHKLSETMVEQVVEKGMGVMPRERNHRGSSSPSVMEDTTKEAPEGPSGAAPNHPRVEVEARVTESRQMDGEARLDLSLKLLELWGNKEATRKLLESLECSWAGRMLEEEEEEEEDWKEEEDVEDLKTQTEEDLACRDRTPTDHHGLSLDEQGMHEELEETMRAIQAEVLRMEMAAVWRAHRRNLARFRHVLRVWRSTWRPRSPLSPTSPGENPSATDRLGGTYLESGEEEEVVIRSLEERREEEEARLMERQWKTWMDNQEMGANKKDTERGVEEKGQDVKPPRPCQDPGCSMPTKETLGQTLSEATGDSGARSTTVGNANGIVTQMQKLRTFRRMKRWLTGINDKKWMTLEEEVEELLLTTENSCMRYFCFNCMKKRYLQLKYQSRLKQ